MGHSGTRRGTHLGEGERHSRAKERDTFKRRIRHSGEKERETVGRRTQ